MVIGLIDKDGTILGLKYFEYNQLSVFKDSNVALPEAGQGKAGRLIARYNL